MRVDKLIKRLQDLEKVDPKMEVVIWYGDCGGGHFEVEFANIINWHRDGKKTKKAIQVGFKQ